MSADEYLAWERDQPEKHEFHLGEVFAMAGGSPRHNVLSISVGAELRAAVRGKGCHVLSSDQRVSTNQGKRYMYPDTVVVCGGVRTEGSGAALSNPTILVEVLSGSTESYDRGEKWEAYQTLASLTDYVLVAQSSMRVEHYQRTSPNDVFWKYQVLEAGGVLVLANGARVDVDAIYEGAFDVEGDIKPPIDGQAPLHAGKGA